ncbi:helix-turn-helix domain-containing protein [Acidithiobacillus sp. VAN18-1]|uniref:Helix-turn-helix domain-containing protein n=1 Tax=Igneacidithiobacillus copahuensis TaxID=2724909 RepID=A0AAE3CJI0_9PROT|nr:helix-turn-helix domain-containing protein [Igneacidithiobacillus copahuensis]MBU2787878.1 helix-turn-helix domain-containing protein [Igneacidithiobacillus copahuensis]MBU2795494.1 helix-turn-helix domain-containing protein [Acidithiobacillus sp. VAN18-2]
MDRLLNASELAAVLGISPKTVWKRDPRTLPQAVLLPGAKGRRWRESDVQAWLESLPKAVVPGEQFHRRPGRKRKIVL